MGPVVTIGIPIYKRLHYLAQGVRAVAAQDYPHIELLVSDNGQNGTKVPDIVREAYGRPFRFRQNAETVNVIQHYTQIIGDASGEFFVMVDDDDSISPNFVSDLIEIMKRDPKISIAMAKQKVVDASGQVIGRSKEDIPAFLSGEEFVRGLFDYGFANYTSFLARTNDLRKSGGFPDFPRGFHSETGMIIKLALNRTIACSQRSTFFARRSETSAAASMGIDEFAQASRYFLQFLETDPWILEQARRSPASWAKLKERLVNMGWGGFVYKWSTVHRNKMPYLQWVRAGFALPYRADYYRAVGRGLIEDAKHTFLVFAERLVPGVFSWYRSWKTSGSERSIP